MKKKLIIFLPSFSDGGAEEILINIANHLYEKYTIIFVINKNFGKKKKLLNKNIKLIILNKKRLFFCFFLMKDILKDIKPDCVFTTLAHSNLFFCWLKFFSSLDFNLVIRETNIFSKKNLSILKIFNLYFFQILKFLFYNNANYVLAINEYSKKQLFKLGIRKEKLVVINNPIIPHNFCLSKKKIFKEKTIMYLGRLVRHKNIDQIIINFCSILKSNKNIKLYILGTGSEKSNLIKLVKKLNLHNKVKFLGYIQNPQKYIANSHLIVSYSDFEGQPNSIIQAAALNKFILMKEYNGLLHIFKKQQNIKIFNFFEKQDTQLFIQKALNKKIKILKNKKITGIFSIKKNIINYEKLFFSQEK